MNLFLRISMAYNVISCREVAKNTQILKFAGVLIIIIVIIISTIIFITIILIIGCMSPPTPTWLDRSDHFCSAPLHHHHHHHHRVHKSTHTPMVGWIRSLLLSTTSSLKPTTAIVVKMMKKVYLHFFTLFYYHHNFHHYHSSLSNQINLT